MLPGGTGTGRIVPNTLSQAHIDVLLHGVVRILGSLKLTIPPSLAWSPGPPGPREELDAAGCMRGSAGRVEKRMRKRGEGHQHQLAFQKGCWGCRRTFVLRCHWPGHSMCLHVAAREAGNYHL